MAWADVPTKLSQLDGEEYTDNSQGTSASYKLLRSFNVDSVSAITDPVAQVEFEAQLDYRLGAMVNLRNSKALPIEVLRAM